MSSGGPCDETDRSQRCEICDCLGSEGRCKREFLRYLCEMSRRLFNCKSAHCLCVFCSLFFSNSKSVSLYRTVVLHCYLFFLSFSSSFTTLMRDARGFSINVARAYAKEGNI
uniref:Ovule protein n=1 Tax=Parascaris univalens TaxID=6257 RepID=A0A915BYG4_PARUN